MESWTHASEGKSFFISDEIDLYADTVARTRKIPTIWDMKSPCSFGSSMLVPNREVGESMEFMEVASHEMMRKSASNNPCLGIFGVENCNDSSKRVPSASCMTTSSSFLGELEFSSSLSCSVIESDSQKLPLIGLKLGGLADWRDVNNSRFSKEMSILSSTGSSNPAKRARTSNLYPQTPICQVYGCNKDLRSSKEYHKRHKVCDVHSKTAKVIVNGIEQRFCQQCSRFHLLAEFDDEKRSCRKRLAGHNERRRKLQLDSRTANPQKWLQYYQGTRFLETSLPKRASFLFSDILTGGALNQEGYDHDTQCGHIKLEMEPAYNPQLVMPVTKVQSLPKSFLHLHGMERQYPSGMFSSEINYTVLDTASTVQEESGVTKSSCALSLLSAQSQNLSSLSTGIPTAYPLIQGTHDHRGVDKKIDKLLDVSVLDKFAPGGFHLSGMNSMKVNQPAPSMISDTSNSFDPEVHAYVTFQRSDSLNPKCWFSPENGSTVNLLQLSSQLQRVEQQRNSVQVKQENDIFYCFPTT